MSGTIAYQPQVRVHPTTTSQTWNPAKHDTQIVLSGSNLILTMTGAAKNCLAFGLNSFATGRYYFEVIVNFSSICYVGIGNTNSTVGGTATLGGSLDQIGWRQDGAVFSNGAQIGTWAPYTTGQTVCLAVDLVNHDIWGRVGSGSWNASSTANPSNGATGGGVTIPAGVYAFPVVPGILLAQSTLPDHNTTNFATASWFYASPIGFSTMDVTTAANWTSIGSPITVAPFTATATGLTPSTAYDIQVVASNNYGSIASAILPVTTSAAIPNGIYVLAGVSAAPIAAAPVIYKVVEATSDGVGAFWPAATVTSMRGTGGVLLGYLDCGFCESYRPYYNAANAAAAGWSGPTAVENGLIINPGTPVFGSGASAEYSVQFWSPTWLTICTTWADKLIASGWDGIYLDVIDGWDYNGTASDPVVVAAGGLTASANYMLTFVAAIRSHCVASKPGFKLIVNGGEELFSYGSGPSAYSTSFDVMFKEQVCYNSYGSPVSNANRNVEYALLVNSTNAGKPVILIEYIDGGINTTTANEVADVRAWCLAHGFGYYIAASNQNLSGVDTYGWTY